MFDNFYGNAVVVSALEQMIAADRIPQTLLLAGPEGVGKATLVRRFAARLLGNAEQIEQDDLSREANRTLIADREKWPSDKRADDPLLFNTHPDFVTFCPEGPLRQISIQQMRLARSRAQLRPSRGRWRIFLIDQFDRSNAQAADSLLKTLEEPPEHLVLVLTAENPYDLAPTIRSRSVVFHLSPLSSTEMAEFARDRGLTESARRAALSGGCPGAAVTLDLAAYEKRRATMLALVEASAGRVPFGDWVKQSESLIASKSERLELYWKPLYGLLEDIITLHGGGAGIHNTDLDERLQRLASRVTFDWLRKAVESVDEMVRMQRRNVQKGLMLDDYAVRLRGSL
jgi:DNA polymerase-3 subunit delta'